MQIDFPAGRKDSIMDNMNVVLPEAPKHKKRHFVVWVLLIALGLMLAGEFSVRFWWLCCCGWYPCPTAWCSPPATT